MSKDDLNALVSNLNWQGFTLTADDIEWLSEFDDPGDAHDEFMACNAGDYRSEALTAAQRNV